MHESLHGKRTVVRLDELGLLGPGSLLAHCNQLGDADLDLVAARGCTIAHNPVSNLKLGAGIAPLPKMLERGIPVSLGTDGTASNDNLNLFGVAKLAAILHRVVDANYERWPSTRDIFQAATAAGARAAGFGDQVGTIRPGQQADLVLLDFGAPHFHPLNNLLNQVVFGESGGSVQTVLVDGRVIVEDGRLTTVDERALLAEADEIAQRILVENEAPITLARRLEPHVRQAYFGV
jgi:cytosine/adenosine deaminase-related metal-dependent hydrolase